jgi:hypothetical protein
VKKGLKTAVIMHLLTVYIKIYENTTQLDKSRIRNLLMSNTVSQCKMLTFYRQVMGFFKRAKYAPKGRLINSDKFGLKMAVKEYYVRDDVSRITAGRK